MGGWTEYDLVQAEKRMFETQLFAGAMVAEALNPGTSTKRPLRHALIWTLEGLLNLLTIENQSGQPVGPSIVPASGPQALRANA